MNHYTIENPNGADLVVRADLEDEASLLALSRYGVVVRKSTAAEVNELNDQEADMEYGESDICFYWPHDEGVLILTIKDW